MARGGFQGQEDKGWGPRPEAEWGRAGHRCLGSPLITAPLASLTRMHGAPATSPPGEGTEAQRPDRGVETPSTGGLSLRPWRQLDKVGILRLPLFEPFGFKLLKLLLDG